MLITNINEALELVETNTGISDQAISTKWLEETKASNGVYRPYFVIGLLLWLKSENNLIKAEGAEFNQNFETARRNLTIQRQIDKANNLQIHPQYECDVLLSQILPSADNSSSGEIGFISF